MEKQYLMSSFTLNRKHFFFLFYVWASFWKLWIQENKAVYVGSAI